MLGMNNLTKEDIDVFVMHQGSKFIVDTLAKKIGVTTDKMPYKSSGYGNTVSSSVPIILQDYLDNTTIKNLAICGFGVGLSYASTVLTKI